MCLCVIIYPWEYFRGFFVYKGIFVILVSKGNLVYSIWGLFLVFQVGIIIFIKFLVGCDN